MSNTNFNSRLSHGVRTQQYLILVVLAFLALTPSLASAVARDVQIASVNFSSGVVEIKNFGASTESLSGWRFCSHNSSSVFRYSSPAGLNGMSLAANTSLFIHYNNDAAGANEINISTIGGNFAALEKDAYGLQLYFAPVSFGNGNTIADHLQWSLNGVDNLSADERSDEAETGGVWVDQSNWISTLATSLTVELTDTSGAVLHSPANYNVTEPVVESSVNVPLLSWPFIIALFSVIGVITLWFKQK